MVKLKDTAHNNSTAEATMTTELAQQLDFKQLYDQHQEALIKHIMAKGLSRAEAEETAQEAFVRLLRLDRPEVQSYLQAYLFKIATNLAIDKLRKRGRSLEVIVEDKYTQADDATEPSAEDTLKYRQLLNMMAESVGELPPKCRQAFFLYKVKGASYPEVAEKMNISESMVRKYVLRAVRHCYSALKDDL